MANGGPQRPHHRDDPDLLLNTTDDEATTLTAVATTSAAAAPTGSGFRELDTTVAEVSASGTSRRAADAPPLEGHGDVTFHRAPAPRAIDSAEPRDSNSNSSSSSLLQDGGVRIHEEPPQVALSRGDGRGNPADFAVPTAWSEGARVVGFRLAVQPSAETTTESSSYTQVSGIPDVESTESPSHLALSLPELPRQLKNPSPSPIRPFPTLPDLPVVSTQFQRAWRRRPSFLAAPRGLLTNWDSDMMVCAAPLRMAAPPPPPSPPRAMECRLVMPMAALRPAATATACVSKTEATRATPALWSTPAGGFIKSRRAQPRRRRMSEPSAARYHGHVAGRHKTGSTTMASTSTTTPAKDRAGIHQQPQTVVTRGHNSSSTTARTIPSSVVATCNIQISVVDRDSSASNFTDDDDGWWPPDGDGGVEKTRLRRRPSLVKDRGSPEWSKGSCSNVDEGDEPNCCLCQLCCRLLFYLTLWLSVSLFTYGSLRFILSCSGGEGQGRYPYYMGSHSCCLVGAQIAFWPTGAEAFTDAASLRRAVVAQLTVMAAASPNESTTRDCVMGGGGHEVVEELELLRPCGGAVAYVAKARSLLSHIPNRPVLVVQLLRRIGYLPSIFEGVRVACRTEPPMPLTYVSLAQGGDLELSNTSGLVPAGFFPALSRQHWLPPVLVALPAWLPGKTWAGRRVFRVRCRAKDSGSELLPEREVLLELPWH